MTNKGTPRVPFFFIITLLKSWSSGKFILKMKKDYILHLSLLGFFFLFCSGLSDSADKTTLFIIGDSTVKNGSGTGENGLWGWGDFMAEYFDSTLIVVRNFARGGRSSRTFQSEGLWENVLKQLKPGDFVLIQFGHNDGGSLNTGRARGTLQGCGDETQEVVMEAANDTVIIHTYGWYIKKYISDIQEKGATAIILSPIPRNMWTDNASLPDGQEKVKRANEDYGKWAKEAAIEKGACFVDLNSIIADKYDDIGPEKVNSEFFLKDHTHTTKEGAILNAESVVEGIEMLKDCKLKNFIIHTEIE